MSWNSMCKLGSDVVLGDVQAQNISCKSITVDDPTDPTDPTDLTIDTITATTGNFDVINVETLNVSNPTEPTDLNVSSITATTGNFDVINVATLNVSNPSEPTDLNVSSITATTGNIENLTTDTISSTSVSVSSSVACNSLNTQTIVSSDSTTNNILNVAGSFEALTATKESTTPLLGLDAITTGDYLQQISSDGDYHYSLVQLASGDDGSQSIILTAGGAFNEGENTIQSFDSMRNNALTLNLNPLGGKVITDHLTYTNGNKPVQANPLSSSAMPNMEVLFYHLTGDGSQTTATMTLANNINGTTNYAVFPSLYYGITDVSSGTYGVWNSFFDINVSNFKSTQFLCNISKGSGNNANVYIQFLVIYDMVGTDFPKSY
jgi:hypothetical protein